MLSQDTEQVWYDFLCSRDQYKYHTFLECLDGDWLIVWLLVLPALGLFIGCIKIAYEWGLLIRKLDIASCEKLKNTRKAAIYKMLIFLVYSLSSVLFCAEVLYPIWWVEVVQKWLLLYVMHRFIWLSEIQHVHKLIFDIKDTQLKSTEAMIQKVKEIK